MKLIVGLGNPGPKYETTRHNAGFLVIDLLADAAGIQWETGQNRFGGVIGRGSVHGETCILLKPMTYMNLSGKSVAEVMRFFKIEAQDVVVLHDEMDVPAGQVKAKVGGGAAGHNGIRSITECTGTPDYHRLKLGVGRPPENWAGADWVLGQMSDAELLALQKEMFDGVNLRLKQIFHKSA